MIKHDFIVTGGDTDSISFVKKDQTPFTEEELDGWLAELNGLCPDKVVFEDDGYFPKQIVIKAKNYLLYDGKSIKTKGSALKATQKCAALKEFIKYVLDILLNVDDRTTLHNSLCDLYNRYVHEIMDIKDILRWSSRKTISQKTLESKRTNEKRIREAYTEEDEISEGDRIFVYYKPDRSLEMASRFDGIYDRAHLLKNLYTTICTFKTILPVTELFPNYSLKKNSKLLNDLTK